MNRQRAGRALAQLNIATLRHPIDDPRIADFVDALPVVNGAGEQSPGYLWRLQSDSGDATDIQVFDDPLVIVNLTLWESAEALKAFAYRGLHRDFFRRRSEWFVEGASRTALWWLPAGVLPTTDDAKRRLDFIDAFGVSPYAFAMGQSNSALVIQRVDADDGRAEVLIDQLNEDFRLDPDQVTGDHGAVVVAELDDIAVAFGVYRRNGDSAEITRMHVSKPARGLKIGAAIVAELEGLATSSGARRLLLETRQHRSSSVEAYEQFGFRRCPCWGEHARSAESICLEKSLGTDLSRLA